MKGKESYITEKPFNADWWKQFMYLSNQLSDALKVNNILEQNQINEFYQAVKDLLHNVSRTEKLRIFVDGHQQQNNIISDCLPNKDEDLSSWVEKVFGDQKFGMIINQCEQLSEFLADKLSSDLQNLESFIGIPLSGYNITLFLGNYGYTPLGIHQDGPGNNVLHYHIGPGEKIMYNWSPEKYTLEELSRIQIAKAIETADKYVIRSGDLYFMPWDKLHIGYTEKFSIGVTLWFNNPTKFSTFTKLFNNIAIDHILESEKVIFSQISKEIKDENLFSRNVLGLGGLEQMSLSEILYESYLDENNKLKSNNNWNSKSLVLNTLSFSNSDLNRVIKIVEPYKLFYRVIGINISVYYRGHRVVLSFSQILISILDQLNNLVPLKLFDIIQILLPVNTPRQTIVFFTDMYQKQAVCLN